MSEYTDMTRSQLIDRVVECEIYINALAGPYAKLARLGVKKFLKTKIPLKENNVILVRSVRVDAIKDCLLAARRVADRQRREGTERNRTGAIFVLDELKKVLREATTKLKESSI